MIDKRNAPSHTVPPNPVPPNPVPVNEATARDWVAADEDQRSLGYLFSSLTDDITTLMRQEVQLARVETSEKISEAASSIGRMVVGGMVAYAGLIGLLIAVIVWLAAYMPFWLSALIVGAIMLIVGLIMFQSGRSQLQNLNPAPKQTLASIQEDAQMVKEKVS